MAGITTFGATVANADYTSARAAKLDYLDGSVAARLSSVRVQTGVASSFGGSGSGEDAIYQDVTISAVVVANCKVWVQGMFYDSGVPVMPTARLASTTNLRVSSRDGSVTGPACRWYVEEIK